MVWLQWLFSSTGFMPRAICGIWSPGMIFLHNASDFLIWTAYIAIPIVLLKFAYTKRKGLPFQRLFWLFGLFILACGTTHLMDIVMFYNPLYRLAGLVKLVTAIASWGTVFALFHVTPLALRMRSPEDLEREIAQRQRAEAKLQQAHDNLEVAHDNLEVAHDNLEVAHDNLEVRVRERTEELQKSNAALHSSEEQFRTMVDCIPQLAWIAHADGFVFWYNQRWQDYTGKKPEEIQGWDWRSVHDPEFLPRVIEQWTEALAIGQPFDMEVPLLGADGKFRTFLTRVEPMKDAQGNVLRWFGTNTDIEDQKRAQEAVASSLSLLSATIESTADCIIALDLSGNIVACNSKYITMWQHPEDLLQRFDSAELRAHASEQTTNPDRFLQLIRNHIAAPETPTYDVIEMKDGRVLERYGFPQQVNGVCVGVVANLRDITERRRAEAERDDLLASEQQARNEAERADAAKGEFLSRMSHELRTPLNAILGFGQILELQQQQLTLSQNQGVEQILKAGRHLLGLVDEVLDITRMDAPDNMLSLEPIALHEVARVALDMMRPQAADAGIALPRQLAADSPIIVLADRQRLLQVMLNLLSNAIKYNKTGGRVTVSAEVSPENRALFHVGDTGHGIASEDTPKLFVPFSRLNAEKLGVEGTGLGLVLCRRLAQAMNGSILVESRPGQGSTFSLELPLAQLSIPEELYLLEQNGDLIPAALGVDKPDSNELDTDEPYSNRPDDAFTGASIAASSSVQHTILLIEDNISNFQLIEMILADFGDVRLLGAMQGGLGVELAKQQRPDLILLDMHLPDIMGEEVLRCLQATPDTWDIPVIVLSADAMPAQIAAMLAQGARQYLTKPLDVNEFLQAVDEVIRHSSTRRSPELVA